jgi:hypothetical protein
MLDMAKLEAAPVAKAPFSYFVAEDALEGGALESITRDFPDIRSPGVFPLSALNYGPGFKALVDEIKGERLRAVMEKKFGLGLAQHPLMITVRGRCRLRDGQIHTDSTDKLVTVLLYLNDNWDESGGRLRLLRNGHDLDDMIAEVPPRGGTVLAFRRSDCSWHGHKPFEGPRRCIMFNWVQNGAVLEKNLLRHRLSARAKRLLSYFGTDPNAY